MPLITTIPNTRFPAKAGVRIKGFALLVAALCTVSTSRLAAQEELYGNLGAHDPSTLIKDGNRYYTFTTGDGIPSLWSTDLRNWNTGGTVFPAGSPPAWTTTAVPAFDGFFWAPDIAYFNGLYHLYYSISEWGTIDSAIGLATTPSLQSPVWTDLGKVVQSDAASEAGPNTDVTQYNAIDPSIFQDTNGTVWMSWGSYSDGIVVMQLDPLTGKRITPTAPITKIADNGPAFFSNTTEASCIRKHGGYYYLFLNFGGCCSGVNSTYNIRVGRSTSITGPYLDKYGFSMLDGGGTPLLESSGRFIGPGHAGVLSDGGTEWFSYHYYNGNANGAPTLGLSQLSWGSDGWPVLPNDWSALYPFNVDAREHMATYNGSLQGGALIVSDPELGTVLDLDGTGPHVKLPNSVANASTVAAWVKWRGGGDWQRIFDFGSDTSHYMFLTPRAYNGTMRFAITNNGNAGEQIIDAPAALPENCWCHVAVTLDGEQGVLYLNGEAVASEVVSIRPWSLLANNNLIGDSQFAIDPGFDGSIDSFRIFARALNADEIRDIAWAHPSLAHRYSFDTDMRDPIGRAHGRLMGNAAISDGELALDGTAGGYARLPGGLVSGSSAVSIEFWADLGASGNWARVFDFGDFAGANGTNFLFFTPRSSLNDYRVDLNGTAHGVPGGNLNNQWVHVVLTLDPNAGVSSIYVNGTLVSTKVLSLPALSSVSKAWSFLGRSLFAADPFLKGSIDEFRIYDGVLTPAQIAANHAAGPDLLYQSTDLSLTRSNGDLILSWPCYPAGYELEYSPSMESGSWSLLGPPVMANGYQVFSFPLADPPSPPKGFFRLRR